MQFAMGYCQLFLGLALLTLAILYGNYNFGYTPAVFSESSNLQVLSAWNKTIVHPQHRFKKLVVGLNSNLDVIANGTALFNAMGLHPSHKPTDHKVLRSLSDLEQTFAYFLSRGAAAERVFFGDEDFNELVNVAYKLEGTQKFIGGNAALMAQKIVGTFPDTEVLLFAPVGPDLLPLLSDKIVVPSASRVSHDEVHLILEYDPSQDWGGVVTSHANRFIASQDLHNSRMTIMHDMLGGSFTSGPLKGFLPDAIILTGFHLVEIQPSEFRTAKLNEMAQSLKSLPAGTAVHLELASMTDSHFLREIILKIGPFVSSLGLNEQELAFSFEALDLPAADFTSITHNGEFKIDRATFVLKAILENYGYHPKNHPDNKLSRIHFHTLGFHVIATVFNRWKNSGAAVAAGAEGAMRQACDSESILPSQVKLKLPQWIQYFPGQSLVPLDPSKPVTTWTSGDVRFDFTAALVCKEPKKTVGLGDAISAVALIFSEYHIGNN